MSPAVLRGLRALDMTSTRSLPMNLFRRALRVTPRGVWTVMNQMEADLLIKIENDALPERRQMVHLTFKGMKELAKLNA